MRRLMLIVAVLAAVFGISAGGVQAAPGDLDPTFGGGDGKVTLDFGSGEDGANDVAIQPDGKIVVSGHDDDDGEFVLLRYNPDGTLDTTFGGGDGIVTSNLMSYGRIALLSDGTIMVGGGNGDFILARYTAAGVLDTSFGGGDGVVQTSFGGEDYAYALVLQSDGKLLIGGAGGATEQFALARYHPDGTLDTTFGGGDGKVTTSFGGEDYLVGLAVGTDGKIVAAGGTSAGGTPGNEYDFAVARYLSDGTLDSGFSGDGRATLGFDGFDHASGVAVQPDGKVVLSGTGVFAGKMHVTLVRYTAGGTLDPAFGGGDGIVASDLGTYGSGASDLALQANGRIVVSGNGGDSSDDFLVARYEPTGTLDTTFGDGDGTVLVNFNGGDFDRATDLALQSDGRIVAVGAARNPGGFDDEIAVARFLGDDIPPPEEGPPAEEPPPTAPPGAESSASPASVSPPPEAPIRPRLATAALVARVQGGQALLRLRCAGPAVCRGVARLLVRVRPQKMARGSAAARAKNIVIGRSRFRIPASKARVVRIGLNSRGKRLLRQAGHRGLRAKLTGSGLRSRAVQLVPKRGKRR